VKAFVTGVAGFVGSHLADRLIALGYEVVGIDNLLTGSMENVNPQVFFYNRDINDDNTDLMRGCDVVFHLAAIARTQWCIDNPKLAHKTNATGTLNVLMNAKSAGVKRFVHSSSCIVYVPTTPYYVSKMAAENYVTIFPELYGMSTIALRYSNIYGSLRQSEKGPAINAIASLRKSKRETGRIWITGDGEQSRDFIHVDDVVRANILASKSLKTGWYDICTGKQTSMNEIASYFDCPIDYVEERQGDVKHLVQSPDRAKEELGFTYSKELKDNMGVYL
jgi:UDP-glucose 4-epimerase